MNIRCPSCGKLLATPDGMAKGQGKCPQCGGLVDISTPERTGLQPGTVVGGCRIDAALGKGGMATVYRATQLSLDRPVALKVLAPHLSRREHFVERFDREAAALAQLSHPNIVNILDKGAEGDTCFFVMEYVDGESLRTLLKRRGRLPFGDAARVFDQVAAGLEYAHGRGVLHRDIKPENILIAANGDAKLADFGIARMAGGDSPARRRLTIAKAAMGTAHYMAPEQMRDAAEVDHRADVYALGVTLYEMLTGELPIGHFKPASELGEGVSRAVDGVVARALAASPDERFQGVAEFRVALEAAIQGGAATETAPPASAARTPLLARPAVLLGAAAAAIAIAVAVTWLTTRRSGSPPVAVAPPAKASEADKLEDKADDLFALALRRAALGKWSEAKAQLDELDKYYPKTKYYAENRDEIRALREHTEAMLRPQPVPPKREEPPKATQEPKARPEPSTKVQVALKKGHEPKARPKEGTRPGPAVTRQPPAEPVPVVSAAAERREELLGKLKPLWAKRAYGAALDAARAALADAKDDDARKSLQPAVSAAEALGRLGRAVAGGIEALKGKPFRLHDMTGTILGLRGESVQLSIGIGETARKLSALESEEFLTLARAGLDPKDAASHLMLGLFWAVEESPDWALSRKELAAATAAGADATPATALLDAASSPQFASALRAARERLEAGDYKGTRDALDAAQKLRPDSPAATQLVARGLRVLLGQAVTACKAAEFAKAGQLLALAQTLDAGHADVAAFATWLKTAGKPIFTDTFDGARSDQWQVAEGNWRTANGTLTARTTLRDYAIVVIKGMKPKDFVFTFDVTNAGDTRAFRFGAIFRETRKQFLYCQLSATHSLLCVGGAPGVVRGPLAAVVEGVKVRYTRQAPQYLGGQGFPVEFGKTYRMAIRCLGERFECYVNEQLVAEGTVADPRPGGVGLVVNGGECAFDNVRLYDATPLPELSLLREPVESDE